MLLTLSPFFRSVRRRSFISCYSGHRASTSVSVLFHGGGRETSTIGSTHDQLVSPEQFRMISLFLGLSFVFQLLELDEVLDNLNQGPSMLRLPAAEITDTNGEETNTSQPWRRVRSKRSFKMKKSYATDELARLFLTGPTDASTELSEFYCRICRKNVSVLTHGRSEILWHFQWIRQFARDQRLHLDTPGWRVLDFDGNHLTEDELER